VATHTGLFRAGEGERKATRVADRYQDTMGFTVVGPDRFLGSGHPDGREKLPPFLGLIESSDAGRNWRLISLLGRRDFHVLEASGRRVHGFGSDFNTGQAGVLVSYDGGRSWHERGAPEALVSLAIHPDDPDRVAASWEQGIYVSSDAGRRWRSLRAGSALLAWPAADRLYAVASDGSVAGSRDTGAGWRRVGNVGGEPATFEGGAPTHSTSPSTTEPSSARQTAALPGPCARLHGGPPCGTSSQIRSGGARVLAERRCAGLRAE
jgi:photosystem II stability/assembly factor-like uncharacterized protein